MEYVMAVKTKLFDSFINGKAYNLIVDTKMEIMEIIIKNQEFFPRHGIEDSIKYRQIIPYCIITHNDDYILFERLANQTESRLHSKLSLDIPFFCIYIFSQFYGNFSQSITCNNFEFLIVKSQRNFEHLYVELFRISKISHIIFI